MIVLWLAACAAEDLSPLPTEQVEIPATSFRRGHPDEEPRPYGQDWKIDEMPDHLVELSAFAIDRYEVTAAHWARFLTAVGGEEHHDPLQPVVLDGKTWAAAPGEADTPVRHVRWDDADAYCQWAGGRLPTEAEWELAAKGDAGHQDYPWGDDGPTCALAAYYTGQAYCVDRPVPVGSYPDGASPWGVDDLAGNVAEWVGDHYGPYRKGPVTDPAGPDEGPYRVVRGGGFRDSRKGLRTTARWPADPADRSEGVGFRCVEDR